MLFKQASWKKLPPDVILLCVISPFTHLVALGDRASRSTERVIDRDWIVQVRTKEDRIIFH